MTIPISPVSVWTPTGTKSATKFEVRYVTYQNGPSVADCHILTADGTEVGAQVVTATTEQTASWTDDAAFYAILATNAGLTPV